MSRFERWSIRSSDYTTPPGGVTDPVRPPFVKPSRDRGRHDAFTARTRDPPAFDVNARSAETASTGTRWEPRRSIVDVLAYDDLVLDDARFLTLPTTPATLFRPRAFVLIPLAEIVPIADRMAARADSLAAIDAGSKSGRGDDGHDICTELQAFGPAYLRVASKTMT